MRISRFLATGCAILTLKQYVPDFQLAYAYQAWSDERASWRSVIYLNLIRSVNNILEVLALEMSSQQPPSPVTKHPLIYSGRPSKIDTDFSDDETFVARHSFIFTERHKLLTLRLAPLRHVQEDLEAQIGAGASRVDELSTSYSTTDAAPFVETERLAARSSSARQPSEFYVRSDCGWKETLSRLRLQISASSDHPKRQIKGIKLVWLRFWLDVAQISNRCGLTK